MNERDINFTARCHVDCFSVGLDEMKHTSQRNPVRVLRVMYSKGRFSVFEATANQTIAKTVDWLHENGYFECDNSRGFPWTDVVRTPKGEALLSRG